MGVKLSLSGCFLPLFPAALGNDNKASFINNHKNRNYKRRRSHYPCLWYRLFLITVCVQNVTQPYNSLSALVSWIKNYCDCNGFIRVSILRGLYRIDSVCLFDTLYSWVSNHPRMGNPFMFYEKCKIMPYNMIRYNDTIQYDTIQYNTRQQDMTIQYNILRQDNTIQYKCIQR